MNRFRPENAAGLADVAASAWAGRPLGVTLAFLSVPVLLFSLVRVWGLELPSAVLYFVAGALGLAAFWRSLSDPEWLLAIFVIYVPLKKIFVAPIAPGINGTNALLLTLLFAWLVQKLRGTVPVRPARANATLVAVWAALSVLSMLTAAASIGTGEFLKAFAWDIKGWLDQFIVFFAFLALIRDGRMARRVAVYVMIGAVVVMMFGIAEWLDRRFMASIERARVLGPQMQPNDFGAFLVYSSSLFIAVLLMNITRIWAWLAVPPVLFVVAKLLLATFSRGAYFGLAAVGAAAGYLRGRLFLLACAILGAVIVVAVPEVLPESLTARMSQTGDVSSGGTQELDESSRTRLVLWRAGIDMSLDNPILGKGFKMFTVYKGKYTEYDVRESDNHNMYLYISSQMGIPALLVFLLLLWRMFRLGGRVCRQSGDSFGRAIGMAASAMVGGVLVVNFFGSRMVDVGVNSNFWVMLAVLSHLAAELEPTGASAGAQKGSKP